MASTASPDPPPSMINDDHLVAESDWWDWSETTIASIASTLVNLIVVLGLAMIPGTLIVDPAAVVIVSPPAVQTEPIETIDEFVYSELPSESVGSNAEDETSMAEASAEIFAEIADIPNPVEIDVVDRGTFAEANFVDFAVAPMDKLENARGGIGTGEGGAKGSVERITFEILKSLEQRPTLVVWLFDESGSLFRQRNQIRDQFDRIYDQLGIATDALDASRTASIDDAPLLTSVIGFGHKVNLYTPQPVARLDQIQSAVDQIEIDTTGQEMVFSAVVAAATKYRGLRRSVSRAGPERNVLFVVVTDERGDDEVQMEKAIEMCRKSTIPVHVIGVPAPFGREHTLVRYVDPDPKYDQSPQWAQVDQGPETLFPEHVHLGVSGIFDEEPPIDSGFGPFGLTRLSIETGGLYFANHPNRRVGREVKRYEVDDYASELRHFFDPEIMRPYRPRYVSKSDYADSVRNSPLRSALVQAAATQGVGGIERPKLRFVHLGDEAQLVGQLSDAQKDAAKLAPKLQYLTSRLRPVLEFRDQETEPRWRAGYDLALGRVLAQKIRTDTYNSMLAEIKRGKPFADPKNNTWVLTAADEISVGSRYQRDADLATQLLRGVTEQHAGTPWALLARRELEVPIGWKWTETYTDLSPPKMNSPASPGNNNVNAPRDDQKRMIKRKPKREIPKL